MAKNRIDVLENTKIGIEFEFFSELTDKQIQKSLSRELGVKIVVPMSADKFGELVPMVHGPIIPTESVFKLEADNSGGRKMKELITGPLSFYKFKKVLIKTLDWISENGWTTEKTGIHINLNFNHLSLGLNNKMRHLNVLKFILEYDESFIYKRFPERKNNVYARSIKDISINNIFLNLTDSKSLQSEQFKVPNIKYFGVNFLKLIDDYIEVRYMGGRDYEKKFKEIYEIFEYTVFKLYNTLKHPNLSEKNIKSLHKSASRFIKFQRAYKDPIMVPTVLPNLLVTSDLSADFEVLKSQWSRIRDKLFYLIIVCGVESGHFNYNSDNGEFEIKDAKIETSELDGYTLITSEINALVRNCSFSECIVKGSIIEDSIFYGGNEVEHTKIKDTVVQRDNIFKSSYIENNDTLFNGELIQCIVRSGVLGGNVIKDKETEIIED